MRGKAVLAAALLLAASASSYALSLSLDELDIHGALLFMGASDMGQWAAPSPIIIPYLGASLPIGIIGPLFVEPSLDFYGTDYYYTGARAVPAVIEAASGFYTGAFLLSLQAGVRFPLGKVLELGGTIAPDFVFHFPLEIENTGADSIAGRGPAMDYLYGQGRFFYPETRLFLRWQIIPSLGLVFSVRVLYPLFHAWDGEGLPFYDELMVSGMIGFAIKLGGAPAAPADSTPAQ